MNPRVFPGVPAVLQAGVESMPDGTLIRHIGASLGRIALGTGIGILLAVPLGIADGRQPPSSTFFTPLLRFFSVLAGIAWIPIATLVVRLRLRRHHLRDLQRRVLRRRLQHPARRQQHPAGRCAMRPPRSAPGAAQIFPEVLLPGALPNIVTGIRTGLGFAWRGLIAAEMIATNVGLGYMLFVARDFYRTEVIVLGMIVIGLLWLMIDRLMLAPLERAHDRALGPGEARMTPTCSTASAGCALWGALRALDRALAGAGSAGAVRAGGRAVGAGGAGGVFPRVFFPGPVEVIRSFGRLMYNGILPAYLEDSVVRLAAGTAVGMAIGIPLGLLVGLSDRAHRLLWPILLFFQAIGDIAWLPILLIWFGFGLTTMTFVIVYTVLFPVVLNTVLGVRSVPLELHRAALSLGASRCAVLWEVVLPGALPNIVTGLRNGLGYGWRALIAAEMIVGTSGIGFLMFDARRAGSVVEIMLGMIVLGIALVRRRQLGAGADRARDRASDGELVTRVKTLLDQATSRRPTSTPFAGSQVTAIRDISLHVEPATSSSVVGPSGCGKTTMLNMIAGFLPASGGGISVDGRAVKRAGAGSRRRLPVVRAVPVADGARQRRLRAEDARRAESRSGTRSRASTSRWRALSHAAERYPNELSGGMQQRVGVVRALANEPDVLLMDEPFASVDAQTRMTLQEELTRIWQERRPTVLFITHDVAEAVFLANRVVVLSKGTVLDEIVIELPRPRVWDRLIEDGAFKALSARVLQQVRAA